MVGRRPGLTSGAGDVAIQSKLLRALACVNRAPIGIANLEKKRNLQLVHVRCC